MHERTLADHWQPPPEAGGRVHYTLQHARQSPLNDRLRRRAAVLAFMVIFGVSSAPDVLASGGRGPAALWSGWLLVLAFLFALTILAMRRRSKAEQRGIRLLDLVEPERGPASPASEG